MAGVAPVLARFRFSSSTGAPLANGSVTVYLAGTTTPSNTWQDSALTTLNTNPVSLDANGECVMWLDSTLTYKFLLKNAAGVEQWTQDNISGAASAVSADPTLRTDLAASGGSALSGFLPLGTGAVASTAQAKLRERISVTDFGAVGDGVADDTLAIQAAIDHAESLGGGIVYFPAGTFLISATLSSDDHGVTLVGQGEGMHYGDIAATTTATPTTVIEYTGSGTPAIHFTCTAGQYKKVGGGVERIFIHCGDGAGLATYGILVTSRDKLTVRNVQIWNPTLAQVRTECYSGLLANPANGYDVQHCTFENVIGAIDATNNTTAKGLMLTGGQGNGGAGQGNTSFNTFINTRWRGVSTAPAVEIGDTDNNSFFALRANGGGTEDPITVGAIEFLSADETGGGVARYNNIYGCEAVGGLFARASQTGGGSSFRNSVFGYNISNGGVAPKIQAGAGGADNATLVVHYVDRMYTPDSMILPAGGTLDFAATSATLTDSRTVAYSKLSLAEHGNLTGSAISIEGSTSAGVGTYSVATGSYTRIGRLCFVQMTIIWTAHTGTGDIYINGLPFNALNTTSRYQVLHVVASNLTFAGQLGVHIRDGATKQMRLVSTATGAALAGVAMDTAASLHISGCYQTD